MTTSSLERVHSLVLEERCRSASRMLPSSFRSLRPASWRHGELFEAQALEQQTAFARWEAFLSGRELEPLSDSATLLEHTNARSALLFHVLRALELAVVEITPSASLVGLAVRLHFEDGSEMASLAERQRPETPTGLSRLDPALPFHLWSNIRLTRDSKLTSLVTDALATAVGIDRRLMEHVTGARRVLATSTVFDTVDLETIEWPEAMTTRALRDRLRELHESMQTSADHPSPTRYESEVSKLGETPVDRRTTYVIDPDTGASLQEIEQFFAWEDDAVYSALTLGPGRPSGFERLRRLRLGNLDAQVELASLYWSGNGVPQDLAGDFSALWDRREPRARSRSSNHGEHLFLRL